MRILHFSDIHAWAPPPSIDWLFDKRILGTLNYVFNRRRKLHLEAIQTLADIAQTLDPQTDVLACTGDLTCTGEPREFSRALEPILPLVARLAPQHTFYVPGNHDRYIRRSEGDDDIPIVSLALNNAREIPLSRTIGNVEFFFLDAAEPRPFFVSSGVVKPSHIEQLKQLAATPRRANTLRVLVSHFPIFPEKANVRDSYHGLKGGKAIQTLILEEKLCDLCLCGHVHHPFVVSLPGFTQLCAGSVTLSQTAMAIDITDDGTFSHKLLSLSPENNAL